MAQDYSTRPHGRSRAVRRRRAAGRRLALLAFLGAACFAGGFIFLWSLGSWLVGGGGFPGGSEGTVAATRVVLPVAADYTLDPLVDLRAFRDLSYVPVKGLYMTSYAAGSAERLDSMIGLADRTEINAFVIDVKDDIGQVTYDADVSLAKEVGLIDTRIEDVDALIARLREHDITPIARLVCFKDNTLATRRPDLAVKSKKGGNWKDYKGLQYVNPYKHEVWEYLVEVFQDCHYFHWMRN